MDREGKTARNYRYFKGTVTTIGVSVKSFFALYKETLLLPYSTTGGTSYAVLHV